VGSGVRRYGRRNDCDTKRNAGYEEKIKGDGHMNLKERTQRLKTDIPAVFIAIRRKDTPFPAKLLAGVAVAYALSPIDLIPDFIPVLGYLDDVILLPLLVAATVKLIPKDVFAECKVQAKTLWTGDRPKKWIYAVPIIAIWLLLLFFIVKSICL
jgi:uncharacterized membrane protein YkvA (DUF1232 family)